MSSRDKVIHILARLLPLIIVLRYVVYFALYIPNALNGVVVESNSGEHWDLGSIPRSPIFFNIFVDNAFRYNSWPRVHHASNILARHMFQEMNLKAMV